MSLDVAKAVDRVRACEPGERTKLVQELIGSRVDVGSDVPGYDRRSDTLAPGAFKAGRPGWNRQGAVELNKRAHLVSILSEQKLWP